MKDEHTLEFAAASTNLDASRDLAKARRGTLYYDERKQWRHLPFRALVTVTTDHFAPVEEVADIGLYVVCRRLIKAGVPKAIRLSPMVRHPDMTHEEADAHWRDIHAPLALEHHGFMCHYTQLSVVHRISGAHIDGFALCGFESVEDLRERFYTRPQSRDVIAADVKRFADTNKSPRRLIASVNRY